MPDKVKKANTAKPAVNRKKKANGYEFPDKLPVGEILHDPMKKEWILGSSIGKGGFGEIYSVSEYKDGKYDKSYPFVVKIEPHENGPLFVEKNFYIRVAKTELIDEWKSKEKKDLGIPCYISSGTHKYKDKSYRFLIMERFGKDLWNLFLQNQRKFPVDTVYKCAIQIIDALEYIHSKGYVHGDIKGANLLLGLKKNTENRVFLVDFGLVTKFVTGEFKRDPKQAHNGTIEYTSCDNHQGVPTRRGDLEITGYNLLQWISSSLPWENSLKKVDEVFKKKQQLMENVEGYFKNNLPNIPKCLVNYFVYVAKLKHDESPDYNLCRKMFETELKKLKSDLKKLDFEGNSDEVPINESPKKRGRPVTKEVKPKANPRARKQKKIETLEDEDEITPATPEEDFEGNSDEMPVNESPKKRGRPVTKEVKPKANPRARKLKKIVTSEDEDEITPETPEVDFEGNSDEMPVNESPKRRGRTVTKEVKSKANPRTQKQKNIENSEDEDEIIPATPEEVPKKVVKTVENGMAPESKSNGMQMRKRKIVGPVIDDSDDEPIPETPEQPKAKKAVKKAKPKKVVEVKRNWRDCPTMRGVN